MDNKIRRSIDKLTYEQMFELRRNAHVGHLYFQYGEVNDYFEKVMKSKESRLVPGEKVRISKNVGW